MVKYKGPKKEALALETFVKLMRSSNTISAEVNNYLAKNKLTMSQFGVIEALYHVGPMYQRDLAEKILKTTGNITTVIDNLEKRKLVERQREMKDRRYFKVVLTPSGKRLIKKIFPDYAAQVEKSINRLTTAEQKDLGRLCKKLGTGK
ncbi:MAG: MarR family transcriptional regulator [Desulfobulbaceae bacterium]|nr:MarR family transcriptional regulator [Desulfobulbaceae bacterium]